jgi:RNA-directed DNA polymerase
MKKAEKDYPPQKNLLGEWGLDRPTFEGADVFCSRTGRVRHEWLSACREERALTTEMMERICELSNLTAAMQRVVKNGGTAGVDGMKTNELKGWFSENYRTLQASLMSGKYTPQPVRLAQIRKPKGGYRDLGIPTVIDRMVHQSIHQVLNRHYDKSFSDNSFGFRPKRSAHKALLKCSEQISEGYKFVVDIDLEKFFDAVHHDRLLWLLGTRIGDKRLLSLIGKILKSGIMHGGLVNQRISGTPQGSPLSPLLSNIVLDELDKELERRGHRFVRYADDLLILVRSELSAQRVSVSVIGFIESRMRLKVNRNKTQVGLCTCVNFLGYSFTIGGLLLLSKESEHRFKEKLRQVTRRNRGISLEQLIKELNTKLRGWLNYFKLAHMRKKLIRLSSWLRHRIRCFRLKQCKRAIGITRFLRGLGVPKWRCLLLATSRKGWYRKACSPPAHEGMNIHWFNTIGLFDLIRYYDV